MVLATVLLAASGIYATTQLNQELLPDVEFPAVGVATPVEVVLDVPGRK